MTTKSAPLLIVCTLLSNVALAQDNQTMNYFCSKDNYAEEVSYDMGEPISVTRHNGALLQDQSEADESTRVAISKLLSSSVNVSTQCSEFLLLNGRLENYDSGDLLARVYFEFDESELTPDSKYILNKIKYLAKTNQELFTIEGHTDSIGSAGYNFTLGIQRATEVAAYLAKSNSEGLVSYGETQPIETNETAEGREQNRRVDIKVN